MKGGDSDVERQLGEAGDGRTRERKREYKNKT